MSNLEKRGGYTPKHVREQRAYRLVLAGGVAGSLGVIGMALALVGVIEATFPVLAIMIAVICVLLFRRTVGR